MRVIRAELRRVSPRVRPLAEERAACARAVLARATGTDPRAWQLAHGERGRPIALHPDRDDVSLSVTHTADVVACAASAIGPVGVDVAATGSIDDVEDVRRLAFAPALNARLDALPDDARRAAFFDAWVAFEALGKVAGRGIVDWRCPDIDTTADPVELGRLCGIDRPTYLWRARHGELAWAIAVATTSARPLLAWRWPTSGNGSARAT